MGCWWRRAGCCNPGGQRSQLSWCSEPCQLDAPGPWEPPGPQGHQPDEGLVAGRLISPYNCLQNRLSVQRQDTMYLWQRQLQTKLEVIACQTKKEGQRTSHEESLKSRTSDWTWAASVFILEFNHIAIQPLHTDPPFIFSYPDLSIVLGSLSKFRTTNLTATYLIIFI